MTVPATTAYMGRWNGEPVYVDLLKPDLTHVPWAVLCRAVAAINRFNGVTSPLISVGGHSIRVTRRLPQDLRVYGALHDLQEGIMGDQTRPFREAVAVVGTIGTMPIDAIEMGLQTAIHAKARVPWPLPPAQAAILKEADDWACREELAHDIAGTLGGRFGDDTLTPHPHAFTRFVEGEIAAFHARRDKAIEATVREVEAANG